MMKKIKKIGVLITIFVLNFYNTCFADLVWDDENRDIYGENGLVNLPVPLNYVLIGILVLVVVVCAVFIIRRIIKKKKENDNNNNNK